MSLLRLLAILMWTLPVLLAQEHAASGGHGGGGHADLQGWKWANFAILAAGIGWAIAKYAGPFFQSRTEEIRRSLDEARKAHAESEARAAAIEKRISNLSAEMAGMRDAAKREMDAEAARIQAETERTAAKIKESAGQEIATLEKQAQAELKNHAARLAMELAEQKVRAQLDGPAQGELVHGFVANLRRTTSN